MRPLTSDSSAPVMSLEELRALHESVDEAMRAGGSPVGAGEEVSVPPPSPSKPRPRLSPPDPSVKNHIRKHGRARSHTPAVTYVDKEAVTEALGSDAAIGQPAITPK